MTLFAKEHVWLLIQKLHVQDLMHTIRNEFRPLKLEEKFIHILTISLEAFPTRKKATDHVQKIREEENNQKCSQIL